MTVFISVVSHGHARLIQEMGCLPALAVDFRVVVKCNKEQDVAELDAYCRDNNIILLKNNYGMGFGANNNFVYRYCVSDLNMMNDDYFIVLNPDLYISAKSLAELIDNMEHDNVLLSAVNLFKNKEKTIYDNSIRKFPELKDFFMSFFFGINKCIVDKSKILCPTRVDWVAGSFMAFKSSHYKSLSGFDERYFMYCEDIDLCYRSLLSGVAVIYYPNLHAIHFARHANRSIFSRHFFWHLRSTLRFLIFRSMHKLV